MTAFTDRTAAPDSEFAAVLAGIEAAPAAEEAFEERVSLAIHRELGRHGGCRCGQAGYLDCTVAAVAAVAVMRGEQ